jgi:replicative superfamily II helicase
MASKQWQKDNIDKVRQYRREWYYRNKQKQIEWQKQDRRKKTEWINSHKKKCEFCSETDSCCLDFHHKDSNTKEHNVADMRDWSKENITEEINKCIVVCANCHRKIHADRL